jgi:hypothetical protein
MDRHLTPVRKPSSTIPASPWLCGLIGSSCYLRGQCPASCGCVRSSPTSTGPARPVDGRRAVAAECGQRWLSWSPAGGLRSTFRWSRRPRSRAWPTRGAVTPEPRGHAAPTPPPRVVTVLGLYTLLGCTWRMATTSTAPCRGIRGPSSEPPPPMPGPGSESPGPWSGCRRSSAMPPGSERSTAAGGRR